jgi:hypothetical protein
MGLRQVARAAIAVFFTVQAASIALTQTLADFYRGKAIDLSINSGVGGGYDLYARMIARHIIVQPKERHSLKCSARYAPAGRAASCHPDHRRILSSATVGHRRKAHHAPNAGHRATIERARSLP